MALISDKIINLWQVRIQHEEANSKIYAAMSNWLNLKGYVNASKLWKTYAEDELVHKNWAVQYLLDLNILPIEPAEEQPQLEFKGLPNIVALTMQKELETTEEVKNFVTLAFEEKDLLTFNALQKYIAEQVEEISKVQLLIDQLESFGTDKIALRLFDDWIGENLLGG